MTTLNLGIVAHVDAGKTSLTERLLFAAGVIDALGSVDAGATRTDSLDLERDRGITIRSAVTSFALGDLQVNIVDTPGHPDLIAEVERSLGILDAAVLVLSAVEGVQAQTVVLWRALRRVGVPMLVFVNKIDRSGDSCAVLNAIRERFGVVLDQRTAAHAEGERTAYVRALRPGSAGGGSQSPAPERCVPAYCGSAITGAGVPELTNALRDLGARLPAPHRTGEPAGTVFAVDRSGGARRVWIRLWDGQIRARQRLRDGDHTTPPVTRLAVTMPNSVSDARVATAGQIVAISGVPLRIGDESGASRGRAIAAFPPPVLQSLVEPVDPAQRGLLWAGLRDLADEDPLIDLRLDDNTGQAAVSLHGEVQKEIIAALLGQRYGVSARFTDTTVVCLERVRGVGEDVVRIGQPGNPYLATIGLRVTALPLGSGVVFDPGIERGTLPSAFIAATEEGVRSALRQGLQGWDVDDVRVTMTESGYYPRQSRMHQKFNKAMSSVAADFRRLAPVVLFGALAQARTQVCEPVERVDIEIPARLLTPVTALLTRVGGYLDDTRMAGEYLHLSGLLATARLSELTSGLPDDAEGEAAVVHRLDHHAPVAGSPPQRCRIGPDPADREAWFRDMPR